MNTVLVSVRVAHRGETFHTHVQPGQHLSDALKNIGYFPQGHDFWRLWRKGRPIGLDTSLHGTTAVTMTHIAMGEHPDVK